MEGYCMDYHEKLNKALGKVTLSFSVEKEKELLRKGLQKIIESHLIWMSDWVETNTDIFNKLTKLGETADTHEDDMAICLFAIDEWENEDRAVGMRYNALCKRFSKLMLADRKQILIEELEKQKIKIQEVANKANILAKNWKEKLKNHTHNPHVAFALNWLEKVKVDELIRNYERWEKEQI